MRSLLLKRALLKFAKFALKIVFTYWRKCLNSFTFVSKFLLNSCVFTENKRFYTQICSMELEHFLTICFREWLFISCLENIKRKIINVVTIFIFSSLRASYSTVLHCSIFLPDTRIYVCIFTSASLFYAKLKYNKLVQQLRFYQ